MGLADFSPRNAFLFQNRPLSLGRERVAGPVVWRLALLGLLAFGLSACSWDNNYDEAPEFGGSVGDGPVIDAEITITNGNGEVVKTVRSDGTANYQVDVPAGTPFPLLLSADGGTDMVTGGAPTFTMLSVLIHKDERVANISPISTLVVRTAQCMMGGLNGTNVNLATGLVTAHLSFGLDSQLVSNPLTTPVNAGNVASVVKANEAAAEMIRRTREALIGTADEVSEDDLIIQLGCDLADATLDGLGNGVSPRLVATSQVVGAEVLLEVLQNQLAVNGIDATAALDAAIPVAVPYATATTAEVALTEGVLEQTRTALQAALTVTPSESLVLLAGVLENTAPGSLPAGVVSAIPSGAAAQLKAAAVSVPAAADTTIALANQRFAEAPTAAEPILSFSSSPSSVQPNGQATLAWAASDATLCAASGGWTGMKALSGNESTGPLSGSTDYDLVCTGAGGTATESLTVAVASAPPPPSPNVTLSASDTSVAYNGSTILTWGATNASSCTASGGWSGSKSTSGNLTISSLTADRSFTLTCNGAGGSDAQTVTVTVAAPPTPTPVVSLSATPSSVAYNGTTTLTWSVSNASSCTASGGWSGSKSTSGGSQTTGSLTASATFSLSCTGPGGSGSDSVNVAVAPPPPSPTLLLTASPASVAYDGSTTLSWSASNVNSCAAAGDWSGNKASSGNQTLSNLTADQTYTLVCTGAGGSVTRSASVAVAAPPAPTLSLTASPASVAYDGSTTLSWSAGNVNSCAASGDWLGNKASSGTQTLSNLTSDQTYTLACTGAGGSVTRSASVTVAPPAPTLSLTASPASMAYDGSTTLSWSASNVNACAASGDWSGSKASSGTQTLSNLTSDQTYTLACTGAGGSVTKSASVTVAAPGAPVVSLSASPSSVAYDGSTTLSWSASNVNSCVASGDWSGSKASSGTQTLSNLTSDQTYTLACTGAGGSATRSASVTVAAPPSPTLSLTASPASVAYDASTTLSWSASNVNSCAASGDWSGNKASTGTQTLSNLTSDQTYTLACTGAGGSVTRSASVTVAPPAPTLSLTASPASVAYDGSTTLSWSASNVNACAASGDWSGNKASSGTQTLSNLTSDRTYTLACTGAGGSVTRSASVTVAPPAAPTVSLSASPSSVAYNGSTTLTWSATNASACTATGDWSGSKTDSGSQTVNSLTADSSFTLSCSGPGGSGTRTANVSVGAAPTPTVSLSASPSSVAYNGSTTLTWSTSDATSCSASDDWSGGKSTSGSETVNSLTADSSFTLSCSGPGGSKATTTNVTVGAAPTPTLSFTAQPSTVPQNSASQLNWTGGNVSSCDASGAWSGSKGTSGSESTGSLTSDQSYTLTCSGTGGNITRTVMVTINGATGSALLSWTPPTTNTDGSTLTDLAGYRIYYGNSSGGPYPTTIDLDSPGLSSYLVENLPTGTYYFVITAKNASSVESGYSNEDGGTIP